MGARRAKTAAKAVTWPEVLRALPDDQSRSLALKGFRDRGFTAESFASQTEVREVLVEDLVKLEDAYEFRRGKFAAVSADVKALRRRLELELYP